jgi:hypothetical protein
VATSSFTTRAAYLLPAVGIVLVLANWYARPEAALAWTAALVVLVIMVAVLHRSQLALGAPTADSASRRGVDWIPISVVFGALMMVFPLSTTLVFSLGGGDGRDLGKRASMVLVGLFLAMQGNLMPRMLPPLSSMSCDGSRMQTFQRRAGWTWVLAGLAFALAWLALSKDAAQPISVGAIGTAMVLTVALLLRLRRLRKGQPAPGLN